MPRALTETGRESRRLWYHTKATDEYKRSQNTKTKERKARQRKEVIKAYGGKCVKCGNTDPRVLDLDHVGGHGNQHRKLRNYTNVYPEVIRLGFPSDFQLLCRNDNWIKYLESKEVE